MKYKEGNGVAEKSFVSIGEDNRRRLDELESRVALLEELKVRKSVKDGKLKELVGAEIARIRKRINEHRSDYLFETVWSDSEVLKKLERLLELSEEQ